MERATDRESLPVLRMGTRCVPRVPPIGLHVRGVQTADSSLRASPGDPDDPHFLVTPRSDEGLIIDGKNWDGNDFVRLGSANEMLVTRRVVDWLLSTKSVPFIADPCRLDITGMADSQLHQLQDMQSER